MLTILNLSLLTQLTNRSQVSGIGELDMESPEFRSQNCNEKLLKEWSADTTEDNWSRRLTVSMLLEDYQPSGLKKDDTLLQQYKPEIYEDMLDSYKAVWEDVRYFPVNASPVFYDNTWMTPRNYGGSRQHEGCDIFGSENISGYYPILAMTEGTVENIGWLPLGGYRIGIRAPHGGYYYYAHLDSYDREFQVGDFVSAGEILGFMGDSGYGTEGTKGKFPVHLHLGIYIQTKNYRELSVNPYWVLRYIHKKNIKYTK